MLYSSDQEKESMSQEKSEPPSDDSNYQTQQEESQKCQTIEPDGDEMETDEVQAEDIETEGVFRRPVKTFVMRIGRMTESEKRNYSELRQVYCIPFEHRMLNFTEIFNNNNPVTMEIGFGMGHATAQIAAENPNMNYLGIEVHKPGVGRLLGEITARNLNNLYIIEYDALETLETMIPDNSIEAFHIFFPDPWPKKKHHKRRLLQRPRTNLLEQKLAPGGYLYFATDWEEYASFALEELTATEGLHNRYKDYAPHQEWRPRTKFEQKGLDADRSIYELIFEKEQ